MSEKQRNWLLWTMILALLFIGMLLAQRQGSSAVKYIGRIAFLTVLIYRIHPGAAGKNL